MIFFYHILFKLNKKVYTQDLITILKPYYLIFPLSSVAAVSFWSAVQYPAVMTAILKFGKQSSKTFAS